MDLLPSISGRIIQEGGETLVLEVDVNSKK
jgi:hypothetical protein